MQLAFKWCQHSLIVLLLIIPIIPTQKSCMKGEAKTICLPKDYVKFELPPNQPITVSIGIDIKDIPNVSDRDFSITLNAYFIVKWFDSRLIVNDVKNGSDYSEPVSDLTALNLAILETLWLPDVEIRNLKSFQTHLILSKLEGFWVDTEHNLMHALASRITFICPMSFNSFPMDVQVCVFQVGSFNYATNKLVFRDEFIPVKEEAVRSILDYDINIYPLNPEDTHYSALNMNYSVAGFQLVLSRKISFYIVTYYLPSGLFVVVSWISFLINPEVRGLYVIRLFIEFKTNIMISISGFLRESLRSGPLINRSNVWCIFLKSLLFRGQK